MRSHNSTTVSVVSQPVLNHERVFSPRPCLSDPGRSCQIGACDGGRDGAGLGAGTPGLRTGEARQAVLELLHHVWGPQTLDRVLGVCDEFPGPWQHTEYTTS